jgi:hypothetical protein
VSNPPSAAQLGSTLRGFASATRRLAEENAWQPTEHTDAARTWAAASSSPLARTVTEADYHATMLVMSAVEHLDVLGWSIKRGDAFAPAGIGRTAAEHALRAHHQLDNDASDLERARRRLHEWTYAVNENAILYKGLRDSAQLDDDTRGPDVQYEAIAARATVLGWDLAFKKNRQGLDEGRIGGEPHRQSTMALGRTYLDPERTGIVDALFRTYGALTHGLETGLLTTTTETPTRYGTNLSTPRQPEPSFLAILLLAAPLAAVNAVNAMRIRFGWPPGRTDEAYTKAGQAMIDIWYEAANHDDGSTR